MKYILSVAVAVLAFTNSFSQMQASIGAGSTPSRIIIYIRPMAPFNGNISTLQFNVAIPATSLPVPSLTIVGVPSVGTGWVIDPPYVEDGYRHYQITTGATFGLNIAAVETQVMQLEFSGGEAAPNPVSLVTLSGGGTTTGNALYFCSGDIFSDEIAGLYYTRPGTTVVNNLSYTGPLPSSATVTGIILPVTWLSFDVIKENNDALLSWRVSNEESNHHYNVQRSKNGIDYITVGTVNKAGSGSGTNSYTYRDAAINTLGANVLYYRLVQVDIDNRSTQSDVRSIKLTRENAQITAYPSLVTKGFYVNVPLDNPGNRNITLNLVSNTGQLVQTRNISALQASNYYFDISSVSLAAGQYQLQIILEGQVLKTIKLMINKE